MVGLCQSRLAAISAVVFLLALLPTTNAGQYDQYGASAGDAGRSLPLYEDESTQGVEPQLDGLRTAESWSEIPEYRPVETVNPLVEKEVETPESGVLKGLASVDPPEENGPVEDNASAVDRGARTVRVLVLRHQVGTPADGRAVLFDPDVKTVEVVLAADAGPVTAGMVMDAVNREASLPLDFVYGLVGYSGSLEELRSLDNGDRTLELYGAAGDDDDLPLPNEMVSGAWLILGLDYVSVRTWQYMRAAGATTAPPARTTYGARELFTTLIFAGRQFPQHLPTLTRTDTGRAGLAIHKRLAAGASTTKGRKERILCTTPDDRACEAGNGSVGDDELLFCTIDSVLDMPSCRPAFKELNIDVYSNDNYESDSLALLLVDVLHNAGTTDLIDLLTSLHEAEAAAESHFPTHFSIYDAAHEAGFDCKSFTFLDQGACGTCWAHASATALSQRICLLTRGRADYMASPVGLSARAQKQDLELPGDTKEYKATRGADHVELRELGGKAIHGLETIREAAGPGLLPHVCRPYRCQKFTKPDNLKHYYPTPDENKSIMTWLVRDPEKQRACKETMPRMHTDASKPMDIVDLERRPWGDAMADVYGRLQALEPMTLSVLGDNDFNTVRGVQRYDKFVSRFSHAMVLVGWGVTNGGDKYWLVQNSHEGMNALKRYQRGFDPACIANSIARIKSERSNNPTQPRSSRSCAMDTLYAHRFVPIFLSSFDRLDENMVERRRSRDFTVTLISPNPSPNTIEHLISTADKCADSPPCGHLGDRADDCSCVCPEPWGGEGCGVCEVKLECRGSEVFDPDQCACVCPEGRAGSGCRGDVTARSTNPLVIEQSDGSSAIVYSNRWLSAFRRGLMGRTFDVMMVVYSPGDAPPHNTTPNMSEGDSSRVYFKCYERDVMGGAMTACSNSDLIDGRAVAATYVYAYYGTDWRGESLYGWVPIGVDDRRGLG